MNINAFTIWDTLYHNEEVRAKFASQDYVESAEALLKKYNKEINELENVKDKKEVEKRENLEKQRVALQKQILHFRGEVNFGIGKIWTERIKWWPGFFYEFFGSLLTGILVSIGAPYWHDLLRALTALRRPKKA